MDFVRLAFYIVLGAVPATFLGVFSTSLIFSDSSFQRTWGIASILGLCGLWLATFYKPKKSALCGLICLLLLFGLSAIYPIVADILSRPYLSFAELLFSSPALVALHYVLTSLFTTLRERTHET
jgi:hypothetical protein